VRTALVVFAAVLGTLTALTFAFDGEAGPADVLLNGIAAAATAATVHYGRTEPGGPLRREGILAGAVAVVVIVAIVVLRLT
jgi:hypothetical protein